MTVATDERLISADSHVALEHDAIKGHLPSKYHTDYDEAAAAFTQRVFGSAAGKTNRAKMYQHAVEFFDEHGEHGKADRGRELADREARDAETDPREPVAGMKSHHP